MKKFIKIILCLVAICVHVAIQLYPTGRTLAKKYVATINFENALDTPCLQKHTSFLAEEEKKEIGLIIEDLVRTKLKQ